MRLTSLPWLRASSSRMLHSVGVRRTCCPSRHTILRGEVDREVTGLERHVGRLPATVAVARRTAARRRAVSSSTPKGLVT